MPLKLIGSGLGRTGTYSLKHALEILGFGRCYHMLELFQNPDGVRFFKEAEKGRSVNWESLFDGYVSAVDYPVARYYKQIYNFFPGAKVIHTVRDPEEWYESASSTIFWATNPGVTTFFRFAGRYLTSNETRRRAKVLMYNRGLSELEFGKNLKDKQKVLRRFNAHTEDVKNSIPSNKLLVFNIKEGWEPLCNFLNVEVPSVAFPHFNQREEFMKKVEIISKGGFV